MLKEIFMRTFGLDGFLCQQKKDWTNMVFVQFFVCSLRLKKHKWQFDFF